MAAQAQIVRIKPWEGVAVRWYGDPQDGIDIANFLCRVPNVAARYCFPLEAEDGPPIFPPQILISYDNTDAYVAMGVGDWVVVNEDEEFHVFRPEAFERFYELTGTQLPVSSIRGLMDFSKQVMEGTAEEIVKASAVVKKVAESIKETRTNS